MSADKEWMGRFAFDGAEDIAFHIYDDDYDDPISVTEVKFGELETLVEFLRYNFPGLFVATPPADDVREALAQTIANSFFAMEAGESPEVGGYTAPTPTGGDMQLAVDILAAFEVRPRGSVTDAEIDAMQHAIGSIDGQWVTPTALRAALEAARDA